MGLEPMLFRASALIIGPVLSRPGPIAVSAPVTVHFTRHRRCRTAKVPTELSKRQTRRQTTTDLLPLTMSQMAFTINNTATSHPAMIPHRPRHQMCRDPTLHSSSTHRPAPMNQMSHPDPITLKNPHTGCAHLFWPHLSSPCSLVLAPPEGSLVGSAGLVGGGARVWACRRGPRCRCLSRFVVCMRLSRVCRSGSCLAGSGFIAVM